jgi:K+-transporting ATPase ATPase C chain
VGIVVLTLLTGVAFPLVLAAMAISLFPHQSGGSLITQDGVVVGADCIGQRFSGPQYFHSRPSAAGDGYDATASGGTNLGPANPKLRNGENTTPGKRNNAFVGVGQLAEAYRRTNGLPAGAAVPIDAVTRSGSGLDPHISPANAAQQVRRLARERHLSDEAVQRLVGEHIRRDRSSVSWDRHALMCSLSTWPSIG